MTLSEKEAIIFALEEARKVAGDFDTLVESWIAEFIIEAQQYIEVDID